MNTGRCKPVRVGMCIFVGLILWVVVSMYISVTYQSVYTPPPYAPTFGYITADCRWRHYGNAMFNYASLLGIAELHNLTAILPYDLSIRSLFQCPMVYGGHDFNFGNFRNYYDGLSGTYSSRFKHLNTETNIEIHGFFQSWKYFKNVENELRTKHFVFLPDISAKADEYIHRELSKYRERHNIKSNKVTLVGVHVRRGDMMYKHLISAGYTPATHQYFQHAMDFFRRNFTNVVFFLCTDSPKWVTLNIYGEDIIPCDGNDPKLDFAILSKCNHSVISVGSFGWWAAWLANGTTVYYKDWPAPNTRLDHEVTKTDYYPPHWIPMS